MTAPRLLHRPTLQQGGAPRGHLAAGAEGRTGRARRAGACSAWIAGRAVLPSIAVIQGMRKVALSSWHAPPGRSVGRPVLPQQVHHLDHEVVQSLQARGAPRLAGEMAGGRWEGDAAILLLPCPSRPCSRSVAGRPRGLPSPARPRSGSARSGQGRPEIQQYGLPTVDTWDGGSDLLGCGVVYALPAGWVAAGLITGRAPAACSFWPRGVHGLQLL